MELTEIYQRFPYSADCSVYLEQLYWQGQPCCPYCSSLNSSTDHSSRRYHCNHCHTSFSVTVGTIFHRSHLPLQKWFLAIVLLREHQNISVRQLAEAVGVNKNTSARMIAQFNKAAAKPTGRALLQRIVLDVTRE